MRSLILSTIVFATACCGVAFHPGAAAQDLEPAPLLDSTNWGSWQPLGSTGIEWRVACDDDVAPYWWTQQFRNVSGRTVILRYTLSSSQDRLKSRSLDRRMTLGPREMSGRKGSAYQENQTLYIKYKVEK